MTTLVSLIEKLMQDQIGYCDPKLLDLPDYHVPYFDELEYVAQADEYVTAVDQKANAMNELEQVKFKGAPVKFGAVAETILREWGELEHGWILYARAQVAAKELDIHKLRPCTTVTYSDSNHEQASLVELHYYTPIAELQPDYRNYGRITATHAPADHTRLTVYADPEFQEEMLKQWSRLKAELFRQEWIDPPFAATEAIIHEWTPENGISRETQPISIAQSNDTHNGHDVSATTLSSAVSPTEPSTQQVAITTSGGVNVDANNVTVGNDMVGRDKITNTQNTFYINPTIPAPVDKFATQQPAFPLVSLFPSSAGYLGRDDVSLLVRTAYVTRGLTRKPWTSEEREAIRAWLQISPLCQWMDSYLHLRSEAFSWRIDQTLADSLRLSYMPRLSPDDSPLSVKAELYTYGVACFDVVFGTLEAMERFLRLPPLSSAFLSERSRRFQSEQRIWWREAFQITLAGLATVTHPKLLQWFSERVGPSRLHVYLLANDANLDQRIGGDVRWPHTEGIAGRDTFLQEDDGSDGILWQAGGLEELIQIVQRMWGKHLYNWGYLGFETELNQQPPESVLQEIRATYGRI